MINNTVKCLLVGPRSSGVTSLLDRITMSKSRILFSQQEQRKKSYQLAGFDVLYYALQANPHSIKHTFHTHLDVDVILLIADLDPTAPPIDIQLQDLQPCIDHWQRQRCHILLVGQKVDLLSDFFDSSSRHNQLLAYAESASIRLANPQSVSAKTGHGVFVLEKHLLAFYAKSRVEQLWAMLSEYAKPQHNVMHWVCHPKRHWVKEVHGVLQQLQSAYQQKQLSIRDIYQALEKSITLSTINKKGALYAILELSMYDDLPYLISPGLPVEKPDCRQQPLF